MAYFRLQFTKVLKSSLTWIIFGIVLLSAGLILSYNAISGEQNSIRYQISQDLRRKGQSQNNLPLKKNTLKNEKLILKALDKGNWRKAYSLMIRQNNEQATQVKIGGENLRQETKQKNTRLQALWHTNLPEENEQHPQKGWLFLFKLSEGFLPAMLTVMLSFILSKLFASKYVARLNRTELLPSKNVVVLDLILGLLVGLGLTLLIILIIWGCSSLLFGVGSLRYPIQGVALSGNLKGTYQPLSNWLIPSLVLFFLAVIFIILLILFLSQVTRNQLSCLFLALFVLLGGAVLPFVLQSASSQAVKAQAGIIQYLPMTYLLSTQVITGRLAIMLQNSTLNFTFGCDVLLVAIVSLTILNLLWPYLSKKSIKNAFK